MARSYGVGGVRQVKVGKYAGKWVAEWELPRADQGNRRRRRIVRETENEAKRAMAAEMKRSSTSRHGGERLDDFLGRWLDDVVRVTRRERTLVGYRQIIDNHIVPKFGSRDIATLTRRDVQKWVSGMTDLHATTVRHIVACLGAAYSYAVKWDLVAANPAAGLDLPAVPKRVIRAMTVADAKAILEAVKGTEVERVVTVALWTGMRQGELLGLRWADVDLDRATVAVTSSLSRLPGRNEREGTRFVLTPPKSARSVRSIPLTSEAVAALKAERLAQMAGDRTNKDGLVFFVDFNAPMDGTKLTHAFQDVLDAKGLPTMTFHQLRHGYASLMIASGVPLTIVSELLGHSGIGITNDLYVHLTADLKRSAVSQLSEAMA